MRRFRHCSRSVALLLALLSLASPSLPGVGQGLGAAAALPKSESVAYVWTESPSPSPPFETWATAAHAIQEAVDNASPNAIVLVTNGVYAVGSRQGPDGVANRVAINKPIHVRSVKGPEVTVIVGAAGQEDDGFGVGAVRCVYLGTNAELIGFTLTNGHTLAELNFGGGVRSEQSGIVSNCVFLGNAARVDGGGLSGGTALGCLFAGNYARDDGGGADNATLVNCVLMNNQSVDDAGGADDCVLINCVVTGNRTEGRGGGTFECSLFNCTVTHNSAHRGGGVVGRYPTEHKAYNSIIFHNKAAVGANYDPVVYRMGFHRCCTTPLPINGSDNMALDPQLLSAWRLAPSSPCVGAGRPEYTTGTDLDGEPFGSPPSLGADEIVPGKTTGSLSAAIAADFTQMATGFAATFRSRIEGRATRLRWSFADGTVFENQPRVHHGWAQPGTYAVTLTVFNDSTPAGFAVTLPISVVPVPLYYVNAANPTPAFPFRTWASAASTIQDAIGAGDVAGRVVWVTNGVYDTGGPLVSGDVTARARLTNGVIVQSVNGPAVTILHGAPGAAQPHGPGAMRCAYVDDSSVLSGFTLTNGHSRAVGHNSRDQGGGGAWCEKEGVLTNCVLAGNRAFRDGGGVNGGRLLDCLLTGNVALDDGGGADDSVLIRCVLTSNEARDIGGGADESVLERCQIVGNTALSAAGTDDSTLDQCLVARNFCSQFNSSQVNGVSDGLLYHCTVTDNGVIGWGMAASLAYNSIVWNNSGGSNHVWSAFFSSCTIPEPTEGAGNIPDDPQFLDAAHGNFRLDPASPCLEAGTNLSGLTALLPSAVDLVGTPRTLRSRRDGPLAPDLGAYEAFPLVLTTPVAAGNTVRLCWEPTAPTVVLQSSPALQPTRWTNVPGSAATNCIVLPHRDSQEFFRLFNP
ncbi:MAG TPA: PKD domain-containing protein [Verrucomicrobiae bacterium]|nr:PKD domain-containing protein [Verrucomicrobiae bacterium]